MSVVLPATSESIKGVVANENNGATRAHITVVETDTLPKKKDIVVFGANRNFVNRETISNKSDRNKRVYQLTELYQSENSGMFNSVKFVSQEVVAEVLINYKAINDFSSEKVSFAKQVCSESFFNSSKKEDLNNIMDKLEKRAAEVGIDVSEYKSAYENAIKNTFKGFCAWFGFLDSDRLAKIDEVFFELAEAIRKAEFDNTNKNDNCEQALTSSEIETKIEEAFEKSPWLMETYYDVRVEDSEVLELIDKHHLSKEDLYGDGKINNPALQLSGNCVLHSVINSMVVSSKGMSILETLLEKKGDAIGIFLPEAYNNGVGRNGNGVYIYDKGTLNTSVENLSVGDGDVSAFAAAEYDYNYFMRKKNGEKKGADTRHCYRGFEILSGKGAKLYHAGDEIPEGVGYTYSNQLIYDKLVNMFEKGDGAIIVNLKYLHNKPTNYTVDDIEKDNLSAEQGMLSDGHAYSVVRMTPDSVYLQESNNPTKYIKFSKAEFIGYVKEIATWKY